MSATLKLIRYAIVDIDGKPYRLGHLTEEVTITLGDELVHEHVHSVGPGTIVKIFDVDEDLADFDFLWIESDLDVMLEFVVDDDADVGEVASTFPLEGSGTANSYGVPFILGRDDAYANYTVAFAAGTLDVIETIRARNLDDTDTARVHIFAAT